MSDESSMSESYCEWILKEVLDDCAYTGLSFEDREVREALVEGLRSAANYIERLSHPLH